jgi:hypothetical protein
VRDRAEDRERVLAKQEGRARKDELARAQDARRSNVRFGLIVNSFMVPQGDLYRKKVSLSLLGILHYPKADILVAECFVLPYRLSKLIQLSGVAGLPHRLS